MAEVEEGLVALLAADSAIAAMVATDGIPRIGPELEEGQDLPAIVYQLIDSPRDYTHDNAGGVGTLLPTARIQLDAYGRSYGEAVHLGRAIMDLLAGWRGTLGSYRVDAVRVVNIGDGPEPAAGLYRRVIDALVTYEEAI